MLSGIATRLAAAAGFCAAVLRAVTFRAVLLTQSLAVLIALSDWLEHSGWRTQPYFPPVELVEQMLAALFVMLAALAGDEAVRRGWTVWRAFVVVTPCAAAATALAQWGIYGALALGPHPTPDWVLNVFFDVGSWWGTALMAYLNRQSAGRILAGVRAGELARLTAEHRLLTSRLATAEAQVDPASVLRQLAGIRDQYAAAQPDADQRLDQLIDNLRRMSAAAAP